jgi:predicted lipoprotein with Yx(FWY)xxD motif
MQVTGNSSRRILCFLALTVVAVALAACGSSSKSGSSGSGSSGGAYGGQTPAPSSTSGASEIKTASGKLGKYLVDGSGRSLYLFLLDKHGKSACSGACVSAWPLFSAGTKPKAGPGVDASKITVVTRSDGKKQVSYGKYPLYYYQGDSKPGDITGQGLKQFGAPWYLVRPTGLKYDTD